MERLTPLPWQGALWQQVAGWRERMPHALLLHGARGIGKRHFAQALAQSLLCEAPDGQALACGPCSGCQLMAADNHPDLRWLVPEVDQPLRDELDDEQDDGAKRPAASKTSKPSRAILIDQVRAIGDFLAPGVASRRAARRHAGAGRGAERAGRQRTAEAARGAAGRRGVHRGDRRARCRTADGAFPLRPAACAGAGDGRGAGLAARQGVEDAEAKLAEAGGAPVGLEVVDEDARQAGARTRRRACWTCWHGAGA